MLLKNRIISINGKEVGVIHLKENSWVFTPITQSAFSNRAYENMNYELMLAITNEIAELNKRGLRNDNNKHSG